MTGETRTDGVERLEAALVEQSRVAERYRDALGTSSEVGVYVRLRDAGDEVTARQRWLDHFDERQPGSATDGPVSSGAGGGDG